MKQILLFTALALTQGPSKSALRYEHVMRQMHDASCGYAVVASLLGLYLGSGISETDLYELHTQAGDDGRISFSDMVEIFAHYGIEAGGYLMTYAELQSTIGTHRPVIVHVAEPVSHFMIVVGMTCEYIAVADPAAGLFALHRSAFTDRWTGYVLVPALGRTDAYKRSDAAFATVAKRLGVLNSGFAYGNREVWR